MSGTRKVYETIVYDPSRELAQQAIALTSFAPPPVLLSSGLLRA